MKEIEHYTTQSKAHMHDAMTPLIKSMYSEFKEISKKKPESAVSKSKIKIANRLLERLRLILADEDTIKFLDLLDEDDVPQVSDVTLILSQYVASLEAFRSKYFGWNGEESTWHIE